jgi:outer membrane cobalamin receptor
MLPLSYLKAQEREWEFDKMQRREKQKEGELDSTLVHLKNKWEIKLNYGRWGFSNNARSKTEELFTLPGSMNLWQLSGSWHFNEKLSADISIGFQLTRDVPPTPSILDVLNGNDIKMEGGGGIFYLLTWG